VETVTVKEETCPLKRGKQDGKSVVQDELLVGQPDERGGPAAEQHGPYVALDEGLSAESVA
jgi:hypothetical protein